MADDDVALSEQQLIDKKSRLKNRSIVLHEMDNKNAISPKLRTEMHDVDSELERVNSIIQHKMRQGAI